MKPRQCNPLWSGLLVCALMLGVSGAARGETGLSDPQSSQTIEVAGARAHFAQEFCGFSPDNVASYRATLKKAFATVEDFDERWQTGWQQEEKGAIPMRALRLSDPADFAARLKGDCSRVKWQADNLLRTHPVAP
ncbi:hypothetical protein [Paraburkholderia hayleyella]|uniref:hypothetical protein n=1 Tax=Paraburkholderia hayleyella TaxID=2152889 RepID=UPI00129143EE|nr:hypothetical protein [Paraburkholderia hayleyella]